MSLIVNADDLGSSESINKAVLFCYQQGYINSASIITNTPFFDETVKLIHQNKIIKNIGVHINFVTGKPLTGFDHAEFLDKNGDWDINKTQKYSNFLSNTVSNDFLIELYAQIDRALAVGIEVTHLDSHYHLHILPCFYNLFIEAAKKYNIKLRLAQVSHEQNFIKYLYRYYINKKIKTNNCNYLNSFENLTEFLKKFPNDVKQGTELMVHPDFDENGRLIDNVDVEGFMQWVAFAQKPQYNLKA
ncbi:MAG: ChbG/HpnK family deacetylase [Mucilaginibacter sp.]